MLNRPHASDPTLHVREEGDTTNDVLCPVPLPTGRPAALTSELCDRLDDSGCPLANPVHERLRFETMLAKLSATFVNLSADEVDAQIVTALQHLVEFLDVDRGGLAEVLFDDNQLVITHSYHQPGVPPLPRTILNEQLPWYARTIREGRVLRVSHLPDDLPPEAVLERAYCETVGLKSHVMIPLTAMGRVVGALGFGTFSASYDWPDELIQRLRLVGGIFTNALDRKRADETLRSREKSLRQTRKGLRHLAAKLIHAQEEERRRIAREMHDDWTQRLAVLSIDIANLKKFLGTPEKALPLLNGMQQQLVDLSEDVHALSRQLHPSILNDLGLVEALRSECASVSRREGLEIELKADGVPNSLPKDVALCVYRVTQEAIRNVAKHAAVKAAQVFLTCNGPDLVLRVIDRGVGFAATRLRSRPGLGMASMQERVRLVRGRLSVNSTPGKGTAVEVRISLSRSSP